MTRIPARRQSSVRSSKLDMSITIQGGLQSLSFRYFIGKNHDDSGDDDDDAWHVAASW